MRLAALLVYARGDQAAVYAAECSRSAKQSSSHFDVTFWDQVSNAIGELLTTDRQATRKELH